MPTKTEITIICEEGDRFHAVNKAKKQLETEGYVVAPMCGNEPIGFAPVSQYSYVAKWRNLDAEDRRKLSGTITFLENGKDVKITYFNR